MNDDIRSLHRGEFLELKRNRHWEYVQRVHPRGAAVMVATTVDDELVLVEQYRIPVQARTLELPAGIIGDSPERAQESVEDSALRELLEETGFQGAHAQLILSGPTVPGLSSEFTHLVRVTGLTRVHAGGGVDGEDITVHLLPLARADEWLAERARTGLLIETRIYAGLYFARRPGGA